MAQPIRSSAFDHGQGPFEPLLRRYGANFHRLYGEQGMAVLRQNGYIFMGDSRTPGTRWAPPWNPTRVLTVPYNGKPVIWRNECPHNKKRLVQPTAMPVSVNFGQPIVCGFHHLSFNQAGVIRGCGRMELAVGALPVDRCEESPHYEWQGLVFELGQNADRAEERLRQSLAFATEAGEGLFDFTDYVPHCSVEALQRADALMSIVNYLDIRHIPSHKGTLAPFVNTNDYTHRGSDAGVIQFMGLNPSFLSEHPLGKLYVQSGLGALRYGAAWLTTPEGLMIEWYPGVLVVSQCFPHPLDPMACIFHHLFYYHRAVLRLMDDDPANPYSYVRAHQPVFKGTGDEDELWCSEATANLVAMAAEGRGGEEWGFFDPAQENYGRWYYQMAEKRLRELVGC